VAFCGDQLSCYTKVDVWGWVPNLLI